MYYNKTNYEIAYRIYEEAGTLVVILLAGTRENFYKELKRYMGRTLSETVAEGNILSVIDGSRQQ